VHRPGVLPATGSTPVVRRARMAGEGCAEAGVRMRRKPGRVVRGRRDGTGQRPPQLQTADYDEVITIPKPRRSRWAAEPREESTFFDPRPANLAAALEATRQLGPGRQVVTLQVGSALKYITDPLYS
jgi:hypothetical protein